MGILSFRANYAFKANCSVGVEGCDPEVGWGGGMRDCRNCVSQIRLQQQWGGVRSCWEYFAYFTVASSCAGATQKCAYWK